MERLLHEKEVTGRGAWNRLFDETMANMTVTVSGEEMSVSAALNKLSDTGPRRARGCGPRRVGGIRLAHPPVLPDHQHADQGQGGDGQVAPAPAPGSSRNRANMVEDEVVDALVSAVTESYPRLSHRYYAMKAKWLGLDRLMHWDRNAPLPRDADSTIPWPEAVRQVRAAYAGFSPEMERMAAPFFDKPWIDAALRPGKSGGAFAHPTVPSAHPYLLLNYHGKARDVMTLAHELGHGVHQRLAAEQGYLQSSTPLTLAETASVFGEMLTFRALLDAETDPAKRRLLLAGKVEDMLNTVVRQIAFYRFETCCMTSAAKASCRMSASARSGCRCRRKAWARSSTSRRTTRSTGPTFRISCTRPSTYTPMPSGTACVNALYGVLPRWIGAGFRGQVPWPCCGPAGRCATRSCWRPSASTRRGRISGSAAWTSSPGSSMSWRAFQATTSLRRLLMADAKAAFSARCAGWCAPPGAVTGIAARVAGERFPRASRPDKGAHAEDLKAILGGLKGPDDEGGAVPVPPCPTPCRRNTPEGARNRSRPTRPAMGPAFVKRPHGDRAAAPKLAVPLRLLRQEAAAAASLGQVHRATLHDGRRSACKLQYPGHAERGRG
jgi:hypothetical protein